MTTPTLHPGYSGQVVKRLQELLTSAGHRTTPDGVYGPRTTMAVKSYQRSRGLPPTGVADPATLRALGWEGTPEPPVPAPTASTRGLWVDTRPRVLSNGAVEWDGWARELADLGISDASIVTFGHPDPAIPSWWTASRLSAATAALRHAGVARVGWLFWASREDHLEALRWFSNALDVARIYGREHLPDYLEADAEESAKGISQDEVSDWIELCEGFRIRIQTTAVLQLGRGLRLAAPWVLGSLGKWGQAVLRPQVYTAYLPGKEWTKDPLFRPGAFQAELADDLAELLAAHPALVIEQGAALYGQRHPGPLKGVAALQRSYEVALQTAPAWSPGRIPHLQFWSAKAVTGDVAKWLRGLPLPKGG